MKSASHTPLFLLFGYLSRSFQPNLILNTENLVILALSVSLHLECKWANKVATRLLHGTQHATRSIHPACFCLPLRPPALHLTNNSQHGLHWLDESSTNTLSSGRTNSVVLLTFVSQKMSDERGFVWKIIQIFDSAVPDINAYRCLVVYVCVYGSGKNQTCDFLFWQVLFIFLPFLHSNVLLHDQIPHADLLCTPHSHGCALLLQQESYPELSGLCSAHGHGWHRCILHETHR